MNLVQLSFAPFLPKSVQGYWVRFVILELCFFFLFLFSCDLFTVSDVEMPDVEPVRLKEKNRFVKKNTASF